MSADTDPDVRVDDASEVPDSAAADRIGMELQDAIDAAVDAEQTVAVRARLDEAQEAIGDATYIALVRMLRAKCKEIGVK